MMASTPMMKVLSMKYSKMLETIMIIRRSWSKITLRSWAKIRRKCWAKIRRKSWRKSWRKSSRKSSMKSSRKSSRKSRMKNKGLIQSMKIMTLMKYNQTLKRIK